ncbi:MAG: RNA polymerase sigma factor [Thermoanaerobaculia bacterium]|nr:RNA polymerase sigma factor [Thermoanaerobaculia bacterium]
MHVETAKVTVGPWSGGQRELVARAREGQDDAREALAAQCRQTAYTFALQLLGDPDDALDVAQESVLRFFLKLRRFDPSRPLRPWLLTIVRNQVRDLWRRRRVRRADSLDDQDADLSREVVDPTADPERDASRVELRRRLWRALSALPPKLREILVLRDYHDLSYSEIAGVLEIPAGTVMSRLHRARAELRRQLGDERGGLRPSIDERTGG